MLSRGLGRSFGGTSGGAVCDYPAAADVRAGVVFASGASTGTFTPAITLARPEAPPLPNENADAVHEAVRARLAARLPAHVHVYKRRTTADEPADRYPRCYVVMNPDLLPGMVLEEETDNRVLAAYPVAVVLEAQEAARKRADPPLSALRRTAQQAVHTTDYPGLAVEHVLLADQVPFPLLGAKDGVAAAGFTVTLALVEPRATGE